MLDPKHCEHEYEIGRVLPNELNCWKCGLLKSTIDNKVKPEGVGEWELTGTEKALIAISFQYFEEAIPKSLEASALGMEKMYYAYLPAIKAVMDYYKNLLLQEKAKWKGEVEKMKIPVQLMCEGYNTGYNKALRQVLTLIDKL
jgi:nitrate reductase beta subunit